MWSVEKTKDGFAWEVFLSAYGAAGGVEPTKEQAKVELAIAQADLTGDPFPRAVEAWMRANPEQAAADYPDKTEKTKLVPRGVE